MSQHVPSFQLYAHNLQSEMACHNLSHSLCFSRQGHEMLHQLQPKFNIGRPI